MKSYPYMTYDDEVKALYIHLKETKPSEHQYTRTIGVFDLKQNFHLDIDNDDNITGIEIILPKDYNKK